MNRDRPATMLTKRESVAKELLARMVADPTRKGTFGQYANDAMRFADALFDALDTPAELRDEPYFDHEGTP